MDKPGSEGVSAYEKFLRPRGAQFAVEERRLFQPIYRKMLSEFLITDARYDFALRGIRYTGLHEKLPPVPEGESFPFYHLHERCEAVVGTFTVVHLCLIDAQGNKPLEWFA